MKQTFLSFILLGLFASASSATNVTVTMNTTSTTMTLTDKVSGAAVKTGDPEKYVYSFSATAGTYTLTAIAKDGETVNGSIELTIDDTDEQAFTILTNTAYATNKDWTADNDYSVNVTVLTKEGTTVNQTLGNSVTAGRKTFLAFNGNSYQLTLTPSEAHQAENYLPFEKQATLTNSSTVSGKIPLGYDFSISVPSDANFVLGTKPLHFVKFKTVEPINVETTGETKTLTYFLGDGLVYNYRTWRKDGLTQAGFFTMKADEAQRPQIAFTDADYEAFDPATINHDVAENNGYETGDIFININERGHLRLNNGDKFDLHAMRSWELTDNSMNNYFFEPDFHYTVINTDGQKSNDVVTIDNSDPSDPWATLSAVGNGTAIVLVTYDAIDVNYFKGTDKTPILGGNFWGAIWPENTAAFVVTVGDDEANLTPNMTVNEDYNANTMKLAGANVDAEHDVFYYLDSEVGYVFTFAPEGVSKVEIAYPTIGDRMATYNGFSTDGVTKNDDNSYSILLKEGRQIVRLSDAEGNAVYQVLTAKKCHREISNVTREDSKVFYPGDKVKVQYSGLRHPANKMAGIYNMTAYVTYNGTPNGTSLVLGKGQYTFGSAPDAQALTVTIPDDYDAEQNPQLVLNEGVLQLTGFGDPIGNHRNTSRYIGRAANFTAIAHKTYFGAIPDIAINVTPAPKFTIRPVVNVDGAEVSVSEPATANTDGTFTATLGTYTVTATATGFEDFSTTLTIDESSDKEIVVNITMTPDGSVVTSLNTKKALDANAPIYDLTGRKVKDFSKPGIYFRSGKKIVIK
ncbi:MAG: hypothetical protein II951_08580 [Bacteroidales bacterium]|nr:hypothetical protein [Bacteroidales bacterium]